MDKILSLNTDQPLVLQGGVSPSIKSISRMHGSMSWSRSCTTEKLSWISPRKLATRVGKILTSSIISIC